MDAEILYDFRSDTVTRPTAAMLQAMLKAPTGDDVFGDDPTVLALESETAALLGKEAALFVASGTMSNLLAMRLHVGPLAEVLCDHRAHVHQWEVGGIHATGAAWRRWRPSRASVSSRRRPSRRTRGRTIACTTSQ